MQLRPDALAAALAKGLRPIYTVYGDEPLLAQEAADTIRHAARAQGYGERKVFTVTGAHFDWGQVLGAAQALSLFTERQFIEIRIPSGKPGKEGSEALQRYCANLPQDVITLVTLPRLDKQQQSSSWFTALDGAGVSLRVDSIERRALPQWIAQRLAAQGQQVPEGAAGQAALNFFSDRVEGNLLAAHQELQKLALLYPKGSLSLAQIEAAVLNVARYDVFKLSDALLAGQLARVLRMLDGLEAEGEPAVLVHWALADDIRKLKQLRDAMQAGKPLPMALREARVWGAKEKLFEAILPGLEARTLADLLDAAQVCDGIVKGLRHPLWPQDPWAALRQLALLLLQACAPHAHKSPLALKP